MLDRSIKRFDALGRARRKARVAGAEFLIEQQDFRIDCGRDGEAKPHQHASGIGPRRQREVIAQLAERFDLRHFSFDLVAAHAEQQPAGHDIFVAGIVEIEPGRGAEQRRDAPVDADRSLVGS